MSIQRRTLLRLAGAAPAALALPALHASAWPSQAFKLHIGYSTGGAADIVARTLAVRLEKLLGQPVVFEYRPGAGGAIVGHTGIAQFEVGADIHDRAAAPIGPAEQDKVWRTIRLDPIMKSIVTADPLITQVYLNTHDSLNRIYPWFDVLAIYPPRMDIPNYNFYYDADATHNPDRAVGVIVR